jgi:thymidine phosphorylase
LAGLAATADEGTARIEAVLRSGAAAEGFGRMVAAQGGPTDFVERWADLLPAATVIRDVPSPLAGFVRAIDGQALGLAVVGLGGGRQREGDRVNPSVGLSDLAGIGQEIAPGEALCRVHAATEAQADQAMAEVQAAYALGAEPVAEPPLILQRIT